jgi:DNA-binding response OmpR family regulator
MKILVIEDYDILRKSLSQGLREEGFDVTATGDGEEGLWHARAGDPDVIVLDLLLPGMDGLTILRKLRAGGSKACVLILTAKDTVRDRVVGLDHGADDYLVKPFDRCELLARIRALIRRKYETADSLIRVRDLEVDTRARTVRKAGQPVDLTAHEYRLLEYLALRANQVVTREQICEHLYAFGSEVYSNVVDVYVGYLRRKLERDGSPRLICTRRGLGYVLGETS